MPGIAVSALTAATAPDGTEVLPIVQSGATVKATITQLLTSLVDISGPRVGVNATAWSTVEKLRVNTPVTADVLANAVIASGGATHRPLVVQGAASQSGKLL